MASPPHPSPKATVEQIVEGIKVDLGHNMLARHQDLSWLCRQLASQNLHVVTSEQKAILDVIDHVPENLYTAWQGPHAIIGWYNELGAAVKAWRQSK